jgi:hypothetical protein
MAPMAQFQKIDPQLFVVDDLTMAIDRYGWHGVRKKIYLP